jgi:hypothetical protein
MARRNETLPREVRAVLMQDWIERQRLAIPAKLPTPPTSEAADAARQGPSSAGSNDSELWDSPGEVVHPGALTGVALSSAEGVDALRSGVQLTGHAPEITEEETPSTNGFATPAELNKENGRRRAVNTATAKERMKHE